jgi:LuxR family quorum sensing-dependent transcriptional regulator
MRPDDLALVERLNDANSFAESEAALQKALAGFGLENFVLMDLPDTRRRYDEFTFCRRVPAGWLEAYTTAKYHRISPALRLVRRTSRPFVWADAPYDAEREPRIGEYFQHMADFGLDNGLMIPVPRASGRMGIAWFSGPAPEFNAHTIPPLQMIGLLAFEHIRRFRAPPYEQCRRALTAREREVLTWVAAGKTAWEIGEILNIAKRTVDEHVHRVCRKLDAGTRAHAVAIAVRDRLIDVDF